MTWSRRQILIPFFLLILSSLQAQIYFEPHTLMGGELTVHGPTSVVSIDLDLDGDVDVLTASDYDNKVAWFENDGSEIFTLHIITSDADGAQSVYTADLDDDGDLDIISASYRDNTIAWYENTGLANFVSHEIRTNAIGASSVFAADINDDGNMDIISASSGEHSTDNGEIAWYENDGQSGFISHVITTDIISARSVFAIDLDNDQDVDVLSASSGDNKISWYENAGEVGLITHEVSADAPGALSVFAADMDADGDVDVLSATSGNFENDYFGAITWYENNGMENFIAHIINTEAMDPSAIFSDDVDGDGDMDVLSTSFDPYPNFNSTKVIWFENMNEAGFSQHVIATDLTGPKSVSTGDIDGDGVLDVVAVSTLDDKVCWYRNDGLENFSVNIIVEGAASPSSVFSSDIDGDGDMDVLASHQGNNRVVLYKNEGLEGFSIQDIDTDAKGVKTVTAGDIDGDGDADVISASYGNSVNNYSSKLAWYENDGFANFSIHEILIDIEGVQSIYAIDLDSDGDLDITSACSGDNTIAWYQNDGLGNFSSHVITADADYPLSVYAIDVDGDSDMDVLSASTQDDRIAWYENDGNEQFVTHTIVNDALDAHSVHAADIDGDGDMDVLSASFADKSISWYENDGQQVFSRHEINDVPIYAEDVFAIDMDNDQDLDVISAAGSWDLENEGMSSLAWFENSGSGEFTLHIISNEYDVNSAHAADLDGDGDMDLLSTADAQNTVTWYESLPLSGDGPASFDLLVPESGTVLEFPANAYTEFSWQDTRDHRYSTYQLTLNSVGWDTTITQIYSNSCIVNISAFPRNITINWIVVALDEWGGQTQSLSTSTIVVQEAERPIISFNSSNKWFYSNGDGFAIMEFVGDTVFSDIEYKIVNTTRLDSELGSVGVWASYWGMIDGSLVRILSWATQELYNPTVTQDTSWGDCNYDDDLQLSCHYINVGLESHFGSYYPTQTIGFSAADDGMHDYNDYSKIARGFGMVKDHATHVYNYSIIGAIIDGVAYGDTALSSYVSVSDHANRPSEYSLYANYPNPFNASTVIGFDVASNSHVSIEVFDIRGRSVSMLVDAPMTPGHYKVKFNSQGLSSGIYLYRIQMGDYTTTRKMVLNK